MGFMDSRPTLAEMNATRRAVPKHAMKTRAQSNADADKEDEKALDKWRADCRRRDKHRCRVCGKKVEVTLKRIPKQATTHHIERRSFKPLRTDRRNGLTCCLEPCHGQLQRRELVIVQQEDRMFTIEKGGRLFWNADEPMEFKRPEELK